MKTALTVITAAATLWLGLSPVMSAQTEIAPRPKTQAALGCLVGLGQNGCARDFGMRWRYYNLCAEQYVHRLLYGCPYGPLETVRYLGTDASRADVYHFVGGIRKLTGCSMKQLLAARYVPLRRAVDNAYSVRNKLFHGQQSGQSLDRETLVSIQRDIREWCTVLAAESFSRFGYDGFGRNSLRKTHRAEIVALVDDAIRDMGWEEFVRKL